jgi:ribosome biogenesis GTPase
VPGRVVLEHRHIYRVLGAEREVLARLAGRLRHQASGPDDYPAVGDWVALTAYGARRVIRAILPRRSRFSRKVAGEVTREQVVAANIDTIFLAQGLDRDFNLRRLERYLVMAWESGARPVIILNKADVCDDVPGRLAEAHAVAAGVPVHVTSAVRREGFEALAEYLQPGQTVALLGSSGVGKSTLINALAGRDLQRTNDLRPDGRGRHTTTARQLFVLPGGALAIDTPGLRELQLWDVGESMQATFADVEQFAAGCYFRDCRHEHEPRCAVRQAAADGRLDPDRLESYLKLRTEAEYLANRQDQAAQAATKRKWRIIHKAARALKPRE